MPALGQGLQTLELDMKNLYHTSLNAGILYVFEYITKCVLKKTGKICNLVQLDGTYNSVQDPRNSGGKRESVRVIGKNMKWAVGMNWATVMPS